MLNLSTFKVSGGLTLQTLITPGNLLSTLDSSGNVTSVTPASIVASAGGITGTGVSGRLALWNGTSTITSDSTLTWTSGLIDVTGNINVSLNYRQAGVNKITSSGTILASNGSVTDVGFGWVGDQNTGFIRTAADTIDIVTNGVIRATVNSTGDAAFGTTSFADKFTVLDIGTTSGRAAIYANSTGANAATGYAGYFSKTGASITNVGLYATASGATNNTALRTGAGNVTFDYLNAAGIVTNTSSGVLGTSTFASLLAGASVSTGTGAANKVALWSGTAAQTYDSGISWAAGEINVSGALKTLDGSSTGKVAITSVSSYPGIWFGANTVTPSVSNYTFLYDNGTSILNAPTGGSIQFRINNTTLGTIQSDSYFAIGVGTATQKLHVFGNQIVEGRAIFNTSVASQNYNYLTVSGANKSFWGSAAAFDAGTANDYMIGSIAGNFDLYAGAVRKLRVNSSGAAVTIPSFTAIGVVTNDTSGNLATTPYATLGPLLAASTNYWTKTGSDLSYTAGNVTAAKTIMLSAGGIAQGMNTAAYSFRDVHVAAYAASATGVLDIELGLTMNSQFNVWKVKGYSYSANAEWECTVGFHNDYAAFYAVRGHFAGHPPFEKVRISLKGGKIHLLLGETSTVWSISTVVVSEGMTAGTTPSALGTFSSSITTDVTTGHTLTGNVNMYPAKITVQETNESEYAMVTTSSYNTRIVTRYDSAEPFYISNQGIKLFGAKSGLGSAGSTTYVNGYYGVTLRAGSGGPEANNILFYGDGSTGNVGIGTTSTPDKLTLSAGSMLLNNNYAIRFKDAGGTAYNILKFTSSDNIELRGSSATDTYIGPAGTGMVVKSTGNVGFGTATPGTIVQAGDGTGQRTIKLYSGSSGAGNNAPVLSLFSNGHKEGVIAITGNGMVFANTSGLANYNNGTIDANPHIVIGNTGLVGVGGTPAYNFDVIGSGTVTSRIRSTSGLATLNLEGTNGSIINGTGNMYLSNYSATQHIYISANGGNQITALANGNVAVNGTAPTTNLHVFGTDTYAANTDGQFTISDATTPLKKMTMGFDITNNFGYINTIYQGASIMPLVLNPQGGNVAIGTTTADSKFRVAASNGAGLRIDFSGSNINYYNANTHIIADSSNALLMELSTGYLRIPKFTTAGNILTVDDVNGVITSVTPASLGIVNWYTTDGTLTSNRTVTQAGYTLNFTENIGVYGITVGRGPGNVDGNFTFATYSATTAKTGANNIFIGADAGKLLTSGSQNVFLGNFAGRDNVTGAGNVCIGQQAGKVYTSNSMTAVGNFALQNATQTNSAFGSSALQYVTTGSTNVGIGPLAGSSGAAGKNLETGSYNTFLGPQSGFGIVSGSYNVVIGRTLTELAAGLSNNVIIGDGQGNIVLHASPTNVKSFIGGALRLDVKSDGRVRTPAVASDPTGLEEGDTWMSTTEKRQGHYIDGKKKHVMYREDILDTKNFLLREDFLKTNNVPTLWAYAGDTVSLTATSAQYGYGGFAVTTDTAAASTNGFANLYQDADFKVDTSIYDYFFEFLFDPTNPPNPTDTGEIYLGVGGTSSQMTTIAVPNNFVGFKIYPDLGSSYRYSFVRRNGGTETSSSTSTVVTTGARRLGVKWAAGRLIFYENGVELLNTTDVTNVPAANTLLRLMVKSITAVSAPVEIGGIVASAAIQFTKL